MGLCADAYYSTTHAIYSVLQVQSVPTAVPTVRMMTCLRMRTRLSQLNAYCASLSPPLGVVVRPRAPLLGVALLGVSGEPGEPGGPRGEPPVDSPSCGASLFTVRSAS